jgi:hypothetical protein
LHRNILSGIWRGIPVPFAWPVQGTPFNAQRNEMTKPVDALQMPDDCLLRRIGIK